MKHPITLYYLIINVFKECLHELEKKTVQISGGMTAWYLDCLCWLLRTLPLTRENETDREDERKKRKRIQMSAVCVCTASLVKINKSVCHLCALFNWHNTVHLGPERNIQSSSVKIQIQQCCTINLQDEYRAVVCSTTQRHRWGLSFPC